MQESVKRKTYKPLPTLRKFHEHPGQIRCIVGPVGSGKTTAATWEVCYYIPRFLAKQHGIKKTRGLVLRNTYPELIDTTQRTVFDWFDPADFGAYHKQQKIYNLHLPGGIEVEILFRSCDNPADIKHFKSLELTWYWIDESIEVSDELKRMLKNRIGRFPRKSPVRFGVETTNPPDVEDTTYWQFKWETPIPGPLSEKKPLENHFGFWQPPNENIDNLRPGYYQDLVNDYADNPDWIARYVRGEPGIMIRGKKVYNNFVRKLHVSPDPLVWSGGRLYAGWDNTGNTPACVVGYIPSPGLFHILREYHTERMGIVDFASYVVADRNNRWPDADWIEWGDPAGMAKFSRAGGGLTSNADLMREEVGIELKPSEQNWEARREAVERQLGRMVSGEPALLIDPSCTRLINGFIGGYCYPEIGTTGYFGDKPVKNKFSHIHDALQYVLVMLTKNVSSANRDRKRSRSFTGFTNVHDRSLPQSRNDYQEIYVA